MNNRDKHIAKVIVYNDGLDEYGQPAHSSYYMRYITGIMSVYGQTPVQDIRFNDCEYLFLTEDRELVDEYQLEIDGVKYHIIHIIPSRHLQQVLLKKV